MQFNPKIKARIRELHCQGFTPAEIAQRVRVALPQLRHLMRHMGLQAVHRETAVRITAEEIDTNAGRYRLPQDTHGEAEYRYDTPGQIVRGESERSDNGRIPARHVNVFGASSLI